MFCQLIKNRRKELGLTLEQIGDYVGVSKATVMRWEKGIISNLRRDRIQKLSEILRLPVDMLVDDSISGKTDFSYDGVYPATYKAYPHLGNIACGIPILADENVSEYKTLPEVRGADFVMTCKGDSMIDARIYDGDIVYIRTQPTVESGEIAAVAIDGEVTLKRVYYEGDSVQLIACNSKYRPLIYSASNCDCFKIIGKALNFLGVVE